MSCDVGHVHETHETNSHPPDGDNCAGGRGGRPICHDDAEDVVRNPVQDISQSSNAREIMSESKGKRKLCEVEGSMGSEQSSAGSTVVKGTSRTRLTMTQKTEILQLLKEKMKHTDIARKYGCSKRTVSAIAEKRVQLESRSKSPGFNGEAKAEKAAAYPQLDERVARMVEDAKRQRVHVTRGVISSFGRTVKKQILSSDLMSADEKKRLEKFGASQSWIDNFVKRQGLGNHSHHGEAGSLGREAAGKGLDEIREVAVSYELENIFHVSETGLFHKVLPRRNYLAKCEGRKTARGAKDMDEKDRVSIYLCANASGTVKVPISIIGKSVKPRRYEKQSLPIKCFAQDKGSSDGGGTFRRWWLEIFLPSVRLHTSEKVLLLVDDCKSHDAFDDPRGQVKVMAFPSSCSRVQQPMGMGVLAAVKLQYRRRLLDSKAESLYEAAGLGTEERRQKIKAGTAGPEQGYQPHVLHDLGVLLRDAWGGVTQKTIAR